MRLALFLGLTIATTSHAATIKFSDPGAGYIRLNPEFTDVTRPRSYRVRSLTNWAFTPTSGFKDLSTFNTNPNLFPPVWTMQSFWVDASDGGFSTAPNGASGHANVDLSEFIAAGDTSLAWRIDGEIDGLGPWNTMTFNSPHLGTVTRLQTLIPERTAGVLTLVAALASTAFRRRALAGRSRRLATR